MLILACSAFTAVPGFALACRARAASAAAATWPLGPYPSRPYRASRWPPGGRPYSLGLPEARPGEPDEDRSVLWGGSLKGCSRHVPCERCGNAKKQSEKRKAKQNKTPNLLRAWIAQRAAHPLCFACLVVPAGSLHPIPFRTRPLNSPAPMVLRLKTRESRSPPGMQNTKILLTNDVLLLPFSSIPYRFLPDWLLM